MLVSGIFIERDHISDVSDSILRCFLLTYWYLFESLVFSCSERTLQINSHSQSPKYMLSSVLAGEIRRWSPFSVPAMSLEERFMFDFYFIWFIPEPSLTFSLLSSLIFFCISLFRFNSYFTYLLFFQILN
jgi:hypothetical protein